MGTIVFSMLNTQATLDGQKVSGFMDGDDVVMVTPRSDVGTVLIGADGSGLFSQTSDKSADIVLKFKHNSPTHRQLIEKWKAQQAGRLVPFTFDVVNSEANIGGTGSNTFVTKAPEEGIGTNASVREWTLTCFEWTPLTPDR